VIALVLLLAPFVDAFWARDLGTLRRELAENPSAERRLLFDDLLQLTTCNKLEKIDEPDPLRALVRVEEARRAAVHTIWDDVLRDDFFRKTVWNPSGSDLLTWPDEEERWPGEVLLVSPLRWSCAKAPAGSGALSLLTQQLIDGLPPEPAARIAYERAVLLWRKGSTEGAKAIDAARLDPALRPAARFLRLEAKLDPPEGWVDLAAEWSSLATMTRAAGELYRQGRHDDVVRLTESLDLPPDAQQADMVRFVLWVRALAFRALGRDSEVLATLARARALPGDSQGREAMRGLAMSVLARQAVDGTLLARFSGGAGLDSAWLELARRAMAAGNFSTAREAAQRLQQVPDPRWRAEGLALAGEIGWVAGEARVTQAAFDQLFSPGWHASERESRDLAAIELAHAMVLVEAESGGRRAELEAQLASLRDRLPAKDAAQVEALLASVRETPPDRGEQRLALGQIDVIRPPQPPPVPAVRLELPEPRSLLAIPAPDGTLLDWFETRGTP